MVFPVVDMVSPRKLSPYIQVCLRSVTTVNWFSLTAMTAALLCHRSEIELLGATGAGDRDRGGHHAGHPTDLEHRQSLPQHTEPGQCPDRRLQAHQDPEHHRTDPPQR